MCTWHWLDDSLLLLGRVASTAASALCALCDWCRLCTWCGRCPMPKPRSVLHSVSRSLEGGCRFRFAGALSSRGMADAFAAAVTAGTVAAAAAGLCCSAALAGSSPGFRVCSSGGRRMILSLTAFAPLWTCGRPSDPLHNMGRVCDLTYTQVRIFVFHLTYTQVRIFVFHLLI